MQLSIRAKRAAEYVHLRDPRAAGLEPDRAVSGWRWDLGLACYEEMRDSGTNFFFEWLPAGEYTFKYRLRANVAGTFRAAPGHAPVDVRPRVHRLLRRREAQHRAVNVSRKAGTGSDSHALAQKLRSERRIRACPRFSAPPHAVI